MHLRRHHARNVVFVCISIFLALFGLSDLLNSSVRSQRRNNLASKIMQARTVPGSSLTGSCDTGQPVEVESTGGTSSLGYLSVGSAFTSINAGVHTGVVSVEICGDTIETGSSVLNSSGAGSANYSSLNILPLADGVTISGASANGRGLIELNGTDNVTIDGDNPLTNGVSRNLKIWNTAPSAATFTQVIRVVLSTSNTNQTNNVTLKNLELIGNAAGRNISTATSTTGIENNTYGIYAGTGGNSVDGTATPNTITSLAAAIGSPAVAANLTISNNSIISAGRGIAVQGSAGDVFPGLLIDGNLIGNPVAGESDQVYSIGITVQGSSDAVVRFNTIYVEGFVNTALRGIDFGSIVNGGSNAVFEKNQIKRVKNNGSTPQGAYGINLERGNQHWVRNNFVQGVINGANGTFTTANAASGIRINGGTGHQIHFNSVDMQGSLSGTGNALTCGLMMANNATNGMDIRNNIFANSQSGGSANSAFASICFVTSMLSSTFNLTLNNNDYFEGPNSLNAIAQAGVTFGSGVFKAGLFNSGSVSPAGNLRSYTSTLSAGGNNDSASMVSDPKFTSSSDLHLLLGGMTSLENGGVSIAGVLDDIDGNLRGATPEIGADEQLGPTAAAVSISGRVVTSTGRGIRNVRLMIEGGDLPWPRVLRTNQFGYYRIDGLESGQSYIVTVDSKRFGFASPVRVVNVGDSVANVDFVAEP